MIKLILGIRVENRKEVRWLKKFKLGIRRNILYY
jgi:hypothetical protein